MEKPQAGRFVARKLTGYSLGLFASPAYLARHPAPSDAAGLAAHRLVGYVDDFNDSAALGYVSELFGGAPVAFQCASAIGQLEAVRAGVGIGALHDFIALRHPELVRVLPERQAQRAFWIVEHEDTRGIGRIRAVHDALVEAVEHDRAVFTPR